jgi:predicted outer membrane repeat protein
MGFSMLFRRVVWAFVLPVFGLVLLVVLFPLWSTSPVMADTTTLFVSSSGSCGAKSPCFGTIQSAVDAAKEGDTIKIAQGVYTSTGFQVVNLNKAVSLAGGYSITNWTTPNPQSHSTVIDAQSAARRRGIFINSNSPLTLTLSGFTVENGNSDGNGGGIYINAGAVRLQQMRVLNNYATGSAGRGGGLYAKSGVVEVIESTFESNSASEGGGGICVEKTATIRLTNSNVRTNFAYAGPGVWLNESTGTTTILDSVFDTNSGYYGGAAKIQHTVAVLVGNTLRDNYAYYRGGAFDFVVADVVVERNLFESNRSSSESGALYTSHGSAWIRDNTFQDNSAPNGGAIGVGLGTVYLDRNVFLHNKAGATAGAINIADGTVMAENDILVGNSSPFEAVHVGGGTLYAKHWDMVDNGGYAIFVDGGDAEITNSILVSHTIAGLWGAGLRADYNLFDGNASNCGGGALCSHILSGNPGFVDGANNDFHLQPDSLAINAGFDSGVSTDWDGDPRPICHGFDLGADEYRPQPPTGAFSVLPVWVGGATQFQNNSTYSSCESLFWDFGDDTESSQIGPTHIYAVAGLYTATLFIDNGAASSVVAHPVAVYAVGFAFSALNRLGQTTVFTNTSFVQEETEYKWSFGDGVTSTLASPSHQYGQPGVYEVILSASNVAGTNTVTNSVTVYSQPKVEFGAMVRSGIRPLSVAFTSTVSMTPTIELPIQYTWDFGDGTGSSDPAPTHLYTTAGIYTASLTVGNFAGTDSQRKAGYIRVYEPVTASFESTPISGTVPLTVTFANLSAGDFDTSTWGFGDGTTSSALHPTHVYTEPGVYIVELTVSGLGGTDAISYNELIRVSKLLNTIYLSVLLR